MSQRSATADMPFEFKRFLVITLLVSIWVHLSEVFRYFVFVMPMMRKQLAMVPNVAPMDFTVFSIWGVWDTVLTGCVVFIYWLVAERFGHTARSAMVGGSVAWAMFFVLFWVGLLNMNLTEPFMLALALPLAWVEMVVAALFARRLYHRHDVSVGGAESTAATARSGVVG